MQNSFVFQDSWLVKGQKEIDFLNKSIGKNYKTELIYRASIDGFTASAFHSKCDN